MTLRTDKSTKLKIELHAAYFYDLAAQVQLAQAVTEIHSVFLKSPAVHITYSFLFPLSSGLAKYCFFLG